MNELPKPENDAEKSATVPGPQQRGSGLSAVPCSRCEWREDDDGNWWTECDRAFTFYVSGPHGNGFEFCPYCGKPIESKVFSENDQTEGPATTRSR